MKEEPLERFARDFAAEVENSLSPDAPFSASVFTQLVLERLEDAGHVESAFELHQEGRIGKAIYRIDGHAFDDERSRLDLFTTIYRGDAVPSRVATADVMRAFERALRFASACADGLADRLEPSNTDASDLARRIEAEARSLTSVRIVLLTDGLVPGEIPGSADWKGRRVDYDFYDMTRLHRILGEGETRSDISVDLLALTGACIPCLHVPSSDGAYEAYLAVLPGEVLSRVYDQYGVRLLELNVRAFLGLQGRKSVNAELRRTLIDQPSMFLAFNNGIVATVDSVELGDETRGSLSLRKLQGLQIVNGGQTTASLHRARRKDAAPLDRVDVPIKIIKVGGADLSEMVASISRAANRQNTVQLADFSANDPFHTQIETLANATWLNSGKVRWFYERARGSYLAAEQKAAYRKSERDLFRTQTPKNRRLGKLDVTRCLSAWSGQPHRVCLGGQKCFQFFMQKLKDEAPPGLDADWFKRLIAILIFYRSAERVVRAAKFPAYAAQIVAYTVASISHCAGGRMDFGAIWSRQAVSREMEELVGTWATELNGLLRSSAGQRNPSEWFKKEECWTELRGKLPVFRDPLPPELSSSTNLPIGRLSASADLSVEDYDRIARCMGTGAAAWLDVAERGQQAGLIHWKVAGICRTLASYAAGGWAKKPSAKQARPAIEALLAVQSSGLLDAITENAAEPTHAPQSR